MKRYIIVNQNNQIELSKANSSILVYRFPYSDVKNKTLMFNIENKFIVYILLGKNIEGKDIIYVGKSKNGMLNRPTSHEDKYKNWTQCFVLTTFAERTFFNDGAIQYLEDTINTQINSLNVYENTTQQTTSGTANKNDMSDCDDYWNEVSDMLDCLGLDLTTPNKNGDDLDDGNDEDNSTGKSSKWAFEQYGIKVGDILVSVDTGETVEVIDDYHIRYKGESMSLSAAARIIKKTSYPLQGPKYFMYNGTTLWQIRNRRS